MQHANYKESFSKEQDSVWQLITVLFNILYLVIFIRPHLINWY